MSRLGILALVSMLVGGCATFGPVVFEAASKPNITCEHFGWGWLGLPIAAAMHSSCKADAREAGYTETAESAAR